jgi:hypothetical protein
MWKLITRAMVVAAASVATNSACGAVKSAFKNTDTKVMPKKGSVLYCDLTGSFLEHSGIYVGDNRIVHLNGKGEIEAVSPAAFLSPFALQDIYVSCMENSAVGSERVATRALSMVGKKRNYNFVMNNCHQFTTGCLTEDFENSSKLLTFLKMQAKDTLGADTWHLWDR